MKKLLLSTIFVALTGLSFSSFAENSVDADDYQYVGPRFEGSSGLPLEEWKEYPGHYKGEVRFEAITDESTAIRKMDRFMGGDGGNGD